MFKALTIAGSDSGGGAGIQADLKTFAAVGVYGTTVITALTAQNTCGVFGIHAVPADFVASQMEAVLSDIPIQAAKTGMMGEAEIIGTVAEVLTRYRVANLVVDPVMVAQSGDRLLKEAAVSALRDRLFPLSLIVTPNLPEAGVLLGREINTISEMEEAAKELHLFGPRFVLVKGGHLAGEEMVDIFYDGKVTRRLTEKKIDTKHTHGTGCTYAAAITAYLAKGLSPLESVTNAKQFITRAIACGYGIGQGYGPTHQMGALYRELEEKHAADALCQGLSVLQQTPGVSTLLADNPSNLFYCLEGAQSTADIASFPGRLFRYRRQIYAPSAPVIWSTAPEAELLLRAFRINNVVRSMMTLRLSEEFITAAANLGWHTSEAGDFINNEHLASVPDAVILRNVPNFESQLLLFAPTPTAAAEKAATLALCFKGKRQIR